MNVCVCVCCFKAKRGSERAWVWTAGALWTSQSYLMGFLVSGSTTLKPLRLRWLSEGLFEVGRQKGRTLLATAGWRERWWTATGYCWGSDFFFFVFVYFKKKKKKNVKLSIRRLGTSRSFGDALLEFQVLPGFFQSYVVWGLGTPGSLER